MAPDGRTDAGHQGRQTARPPGETHQAPRVGGHRVPQDGHTPRPPDRQQAPRTDGHHVPQDTQTPRSKGRRQTEPGFARTDGRGTPRDNRTQPPPGRTDRHGQRAADGPQAWQDRQTDAPALSSPDSPLKDPLIGEEDAQHDGEVALGTGQGCGGGTCPPPAGHDDAVGTWGERREHPQIPPKSPQFPPGRPHPAGGRAASAGTPRGAAGSGAGWRAGSASPAWSASSGRSVCPAWGGRDVPGGHRGRPGTPGAPAAPRTPLQGDAPAPLTSGRSGLCSWSC